MLVRLCQVCRLYELCRSLCDQTWPTKFTGILLAADPNIQKHSCNYQAIIEMSLDLVFCQSRIAGAFEPLFVQKLESQSGRRSVQKGSTTESSAGEPP